MWMVPENLNIFCLEKRCTLFNYFSQWTFVVYYSMLPVNFALEDALRGLDEDDRESISDSYSIDDME